MWPCSPRPLQINRGQFSKVWVFSLEVPHHGPSQPFTMCPVWSHLKHFWSTSADSFAFARPRFSIALHESPACPCRPHFQHNHWLESLGQSNVKCSSPQYAHRSSHGHSFALWPWWWQFRQLRNLPHVSDAWGGEGAASRVDTLPESKGAWNWNNNWRKKIPIS